MKNNGNAIDDFVCKISYGLIRFFSTIKESTVLNNILWRPLYIVWKTIYAFLPWVLLAVLLKVVEWLVIINLQDKTIKNISIFPKDIYIGKMEIVNLCY